MGTLIEAFGEKKTYTEWERDSRCRVSRQVLRVRIATSGWAAERAITQEPSRPRSGAKKYQAFGESKTIREWAMDERCVVAESVLRRRVYFSWDMERAITEQRSAAHAHQD